MDAKGDTDRMEAVKLKNLSPSWVRWLDWLAGEKEKLNRGYWEMAVRFTAGRVASTKIEENYIPEQWRSQPPIPEELSPSGQVL
jgi:hypothetical protein